MGGFIKFLLLIALVGVTAFGVYVATHLDNFLPKQEEVEEEAPPPPPKPKEVETGEDVIGEEEKPAEPTPTPPPPKKTIAELKAEADAAQKEVDARIAAARKDGRKPLTGFSGVNFGERIKATPIRMEEREDGGIAAVVWGPKAKKPFLGFTERPLVWVTPKTFQPYKIQFTAYLPKAAVDKPSPVTTNVAAQLATKLRRDPIAVDMEKFPLARREYVFPFGESTLTLSEHGGTKLDLVIENPAYAAKVKEETEIVKRETEEDRGNSKVLSSDKYPNGGKMAKRVSIKKGTPKSFCGVVFGTLPPYAAQISNPRKGEKGFFLDYRTAKCAPFMGFDHGRADVSRESGGVVAVHLYSEGPQDGLTEQEYFAKVKAAIERHYKLKAPTSQKGSGEFPELTYAVGDLEITLGHDQRGGFFLNAVNQKLALF